MEFNQEKIEAAIIEQAASALVDNDHLWNRVSKSVDERINKIFAETVDDQVAEKVASAVQEGFATQYRKIDNFGRPVGEPTSIGVELTKMISGYWSERVGRDGKPKTDSYGTTTRAEWMMAQLCAEDFSKELKQAAVNVTAGLKDGLRAELKGAVNRILAPLMAVQSDEDKKEGRRQ